ncbi:MAG: proline dehydrogenase family protein [Bacteroidales bacterium]|nr:proline dehydrogenase family protein [Bacteroidales bacterium]
MFINKIIAKIVSVMPEKLVWIFSKKYIAGKTLDDAVRVTRQLNSGGITATIDVLGEYIRKTQEALEYKEGYIKTIEAIHSNNLKATLSLKPSMFGLLIDKDFCFGHIREVVKFAHDSNISICLDMEDSTCTDNELDIFERLYREFPKTVSFVLQAYLHRTIRDLERLSKINNAESPINVRICKGIYIEPQQIAYQKKQDVNKNYVRCLTYMAANNFYCSIATHDKKLITAANHIISQYKLAKDRYEFQMLYGVRPDLRKTIVDKGHAMRVYVPYGTHWFGYSTRRLKENPRMITHILKALIFRG